MAGEMLNGGSSMTLLLQKERLPSSPELIQTSRLQNSEPSFQGDLLSSCFWLLLFIRTSKLLGSIFLNKIRSGFLVDSGLILIKNLSHMKPSLRKMFF